MHPTDLRKQFIALRLAGFTKEQIKQSFKNKVEQQVREKAQNVYDAMGLLQAEAKTSQKELSQEIGAIDPLRASRVQLQHLEETLETTAHEQKNLKDTLHKESTKLIAYQRENKVALQKLWRLKRQQEQQGISPLNAFVTECVQRLNIQIAGRFKNGY